MESFSNGLDIRNIPFATLEFKDYASNPMIETVTRTRQLVVILVEVTKYDADGYLIQFYKGVLPCNTLAAMWSLTESACLA